jgi:hypothetical protein
MLPYFSHCSNPTRSQKLPPVRPSLQLINKTWRGEGFEYALRGEENSSLLFNKMLTECQDNEEEYSKAADTRGVSSYS